MHLAHRPLNVNVTDSTCTAAAECSRSLGRIAARKSTARQRQRCVAQGTDGQEHRIRCRRAVSLCRASSTEPMTASSIEISSIDYFATDKRPVILFDGVCNMCNGGVNFVLDWDKQGEYRFAALQSRPGQQLLVRCGRRPNDISSIVLVEEHGCYIKSDAVLRIATKLNMPWPLLASLAFLTPRFVRDPVYDQVAANRYLVFGKRNSCRVTDDGFKERFLGD